MDSDLIIFAIIFGMMFGITCCAISSFIANTIIKATDLYKERQKYLDKLLLLKDISDVIRRE